MSAFADSSAIVKLYVEEPGSDQARSWTGPWFVSSLAQVEVSAALWRKQRFDRRRAGDVRLVAEAFRRDLADLTGEVAMLPVVTTVPSVERATSLVARHPLRAYDAIQLATALTVRDVAPVGEFLAFDQALCAAAASEGFDVPFEELLADPT